MIVAITGGTGFIGRRLVDRLVERGDKVRLLVRSDLAAHNKFSSVEIFKCDLHALNENNLSSLLQGVDVLYHCAAENIFEDKMYATNVEATMKLACAAKGKIKHWVQLSSVGVYGTHIDGVITEKTILAPVNVYERSKVEAEGIVIEAAKYGGFSYSILRPSKVYGIGMTNGVLFQLIDLIDRRLFFFVGKAGATANYIHVEDVVDVIIKCGCMPEAKNEIYNISDCISLEDFVAIIARALNMPTPRYRLPESLVRTLTRMTAFIPANPLTKQRINAMTKRAVYSSEKIKVELGYKQRISMESGLFDLVTGVKERLDGSAM